MVRRTKWIAVVALLCLAGGVRAESLALDASRHATRGPAVVESTEQGLTLKIDDPRNAALVINAPEGDWDLSRWDIIAVDVENLSADLQARLLMSIYADVANQPGDRANNVGIGLNPGEKRTLRVKLYHDWKYGHPDGVPGIRVVDTRRVSRIEFFVQWPYESTTPGLVNCRLTNLRVEGSLTPTAPKTEAAYLPFIDEYGQFIHDDWPAKVKSAEDLKKNRARELAELDRSSRPDQWNRFGGWANGPQLEATGAFRVEKYQGKWYFVDPEGRLFFSHGVDVLSTYNDPLKVLPGKESWFKSIPPDAKVYQPTELALQQKYGTADYRPAYFETLARRLEHWGFNSIGNWSRAELMDLGRTPYALQLTDYDWKMPRLAGSKIKFYDVFDPAYIRKFEMLIADAAQRNPIVQKSLTDPMCIGYFIDNELNFGNRSGGTVTDEVMKCPPTQASKLELVSDLKKKYETIGRLNESWKTEYADWDGLLQSVVVPASEGYKADAAVFFKKVVDQYFRLARDSIKSVAPHRLYLGTRFISTDAVRPVLREASQEFGDVLTVNIYSHSAANFPVESMPDMPVLIGEFHFGVLDRGMFHASLAQAGINQEDRATAYTRFMQGVLVHPNFVGAHWFQYRDQPLTGRGDSEAYQIGFVDVADTPYEELCRAAREVGEHMYSYRAAGKLTNNMAGE